MTQKTEKVTRKLRDMEKLIESLKSVTLEDCKDKRIINKLAEVSLISNDFLSMFKLKLQPMLIKEGHKRRVK